MARVLLGEPPARLILAREGGRVLGFVHHEGERFGPIGVAAPERGRGLGRVLMFRALAAMREEGFRIAWFLWSDDATARRLYHPGGFREVRRFAILRKDLEGGERGRPPGKEARSIAGHPERFRDHEP
jgi:ribosomal protein S18 acetylase RimI-like enzyme